MGHRVLARIVDKYNICNMRGENFVIMPKSSLEGWMKMFAILFDMLRIDLVNLLSILYSFLMSSLEKGTTQ